MITTTVLVLGQRVSQDGVRTLFNRLRAASARHNGVAGDPAWNHVPHPGTGHASIDDRFPGHWRFQLISATRGAPCQPAGLPADVRVVYRMDGLALVDGDPELGDPAHLVRVTFDSFAGGSDSDRLAAHGVLVGVVTTWAAEHGLRRVWSDGRAAWSAGPWRSGL